MRKFKIGDSVMIKKDLITGVKYYNEDGTGDIFTSRMRKYRGEEAVIIEVNSMGYKLDIDDFHTYTESMLEDPYDELVRSEYSFNPNVERVIGDSLKHYYEDLMNKALEDKLFESDPKKFEEIIKAYNKHSN